MSAVGGDPASQNGHRDMSAPVEISAVPVRAAHRIAGELRMRIKTGRLLPGDRLIERDLARDLGVSRIPVREAVQELIRDGLADASINRGARVHRYTGAEVDDLFDIRAVLEGLAAGRAAARRTFDQLEEMEGLGSDAQGHLESGRILECMVATEQWHELLVAMASSPALETAFAPVHSRLSWLLYLNPDPPAILREHAAIWGAIADQNPARAERLARRHARSALAHVRKALPAAEEAHSSTANSKPAP